MAARGHGVEAGSDSKLIAHTRIRSRQSTSGISSEPDTLVYGFEVDRDRPATLLARALQDDALLPPSLTRSRPNHEVIAVEVLGPGGDAVYASRPAGGTSAAARYVRAVGDGAAVSRGPGATENRMRPRGYAL